MEYFSAKVKGTSFSSEPAGKMRQSIAAVS